ncbi:hypothetical protein PTKIN_Ptkin06aG0164300 [Pterospermum kingtungense]
MTTIVSRSYSSSASKIVDLKYGDQKNGFAVLNSTLSAANLKSVDKGKGVIGSSLPLIASDLKNGDTGKGVVGAKENGIIGDKGKGVIAAYKQTWTALFGDSNNLSDLNPSLEFYPPKASGDTEAPTVSLPSTVLDAGESQWKNALAAQFVGKLPNFSLFVRMVNKLWGSEGEIDIRPTGSNMFILQFPNDRIRDRILESGPWHIQNRPLFLRKWEPGLETLSFDLQKVLLWVHLVNVPLEAFNRQGLSYISSAIGTPLYMDRITATQQRLAYAKVCVEVDALKEIPKTINVEMREGRVIQVKVDIPWYPQRCQHCKIFGHNTKSCVKQHVVTKERWVPKHVPAQAPAQVPAHPAQVPAQVPASVSVQVSNLNKVPIPNSTVLKQMMAHNLVSSVNRFDALRFDLENSVDCAISDLQESKSCETVQHEQNEHSVYYVEGKQLLQVQDSDDDIHDESTGLVPVEDIILEKKPRRAALNVSKVVTALKPQPQNSKGNSKKKAKVGQSASGGSSAPSSC